MPSPALSWSVRCCRLAGLTLVTALAFVAVLIASINIFGGFTVTQRMLKMFRKD